MLSAICFNLDQSKILLSVNELPNDKIKDFSKLKAFADNKINVTEKLKIV